MFSSITLLLMVITEKGEYNTFIDLPGGMTKMKKELDYFFVDHHYGGNQDIMKDLVMRFGGCAALTACDSSIFLDLYHGTHLYPFDCRHISQKDYEAFASIMKPYLHPRMTGISRLELFTEGFGAYIRDHSDCTLQFTEFAGDNPLSDAREQIIKKIDESYPVPYLMLYNQHSFLKDFAWHWFVINGYAKADDAFYVKVVSYGEFRWFRLPDLWHTGYKRKGGLILINSCRDMT